MAEPNDPEHLASVVARANEVIAGCEIALLEDLANSEQKKVSQRRKRVVASALTGFVFPFAANELYEIGGHSYRGIVMVSIAGLAGIALRRFEPSSISDTEGLI